MKIQIVERQPVKVACPTPPDKCRYDACVELPRGLTLPDVAETTIAGDRYAITCFKGTNAEIGAAWGAFSCELCLPLGS